jgi:uncharacterized membrane protein
MDVDVFSWFGPMMVLTFAIPIITVGAVVGVIIWAIRRQVPAGEDPAGAELKGRLARGEIDTSEYQVRLRALQEDD